MKKTIKIPIILVAGLALMCFATTALSQPYDNWRSLFTVLTFQDFVSGSGDPSNNVVGSSPNWRYTADVGSDDPQNDVWERPFESGFDDSSGTYAALNYFGVYDIVSGEYAIDKTTDFLYFGINLAGGFEGVADDQFKSHNFDAQYNIRLSDNNYDGSGSGGYLLSADDPTGNAASSFTTIAGKGTAAWQDSETSGREVVGSTGGRSTAEECASTSCNGFDTSIISGDGKLGGSDQVVLWQRLLDNGNNVSSVDIAWDYGNTGLTDAQAMELIYVEFEANSGTQGNSKYALNDQFVIFGTGGQIGSPEFDPGNPSQQEPGFGNLSGINNIKRLDTVSGVVPIPGAVWLLGTGLIGLIGLRRKLSK